MQASPSRGVDRGSHLAPEEGILKAARVDHLRQAELARGEILGFHPTARHGRAAEGRGGDGREAAGYRELAVEVGVTHLHADRAKHPLDGGQGMEHPRKEVLDLPVGVGPVGQIERELLGAGVELRVQAAGAMPSHADSDAVAVGVLVVPAEADADAAERHRRTRAARV